MVMKSRQALAHRALERQVGYQQRKAEQVKGREAFVLATMLESSGRVRTLLEGFGTIGEGARVVEVGSGAHGLIFGFGARRGVGIDPLAVSYRTLFPMWQPRAATIAAIGEQLPFSDGSIDVVLCDNVVDHAESPRRIVEEIARILRPGGLFSR
jgi:SAM-dependent methyltransferase